MSNRKEVYVYGDKKSSYFLDNALGESYTFRCSDYSPDILWLDYVPNRGGVWHHYRRMLRMRLLFGWQPILCFSSGETHRKFSGIDYSFSYSRNSKKNCFWIYCMGNHYIRYMLMNQKNEDMKKWGKVRKTRFCNFIYTNDRRDTWVRRDLCKLLSKYKRVDCPGYSLNNMPRIERGRSKQLNFMAEYKFTIASEHTLSDYYLTEKIFHAFLAGTVPIYWGNPKAANFFNPAAFVNCHDYDSFDDVVDRVREIDTNPELYESYRQAQPILPNSHLYLMEKKIRERCVFIVEKALARRNKKENYLLSKIRLISLVVSNLDLEIKNLLLAVLGRLGVDGYLRSFVDFLAQLRRKKGSNSLFR